MLTAQNHFFGRTKVMVCSKSLGAQLPAQEESKKELEKENIVFLLLAF
jgi:hypothetical protein